MDISFREEDIIDIPLEYQNKLFCSTKPFVNGARNYYYVSKNRLYLIPHYENLPNPIEPYQGLELSLIKSMSDNSAIMLIPFNVLLTHSNLEIRAWAAKVKINGNNTN